MMRTVYGRMGTLGGGAYARFEEFEDTGCLKTRICASRHYGKS